MKKARKKGQSRIKMKCPSCSTVFLPSLEEKVSFSNSAIAIGRGQGAPRLPGCEFVMMLYAWSPN